MPLPLFPVRELDLTKTDRQSLLYRLQVLARQVIPSWGDFTLNYPENVLLEGCATIGAMIISTMDERLRQHALATLTDRLAAIRKARVPGYTFQGATAAQVSGTFRLPNSALATKQIPLAAGFRLQSGDAIYQLLAATTIEVGNNACAACTIENSEDQTHSQMSEEVANIVIQLNDTDIIEGSIAVTADDGDYTNCYSGTTTKYRTFAEVGPDDRVFIAMLDSNGRAYVFFGNGINGAIPRGTINITYKTGGGEAGRIDALATWKLLDAAYDVDGQIVTLEFYNSTASVGGYNATTVEEARIGIPQAMRTQERCVNEDDFEYAATTVAGIARAALMTSNQDASIAENVAYLYPIAYGTPYATSGYYPPATPTTAQKALIAAAINKSTGAYKQLMGVTVSIYDPVFRLINVKVKIRKKSSYTATQVKDAITDALQQFFAVADSDRVQNTNLNFGYKYVNSEGEIDCQLDWSQIFDAILEADGVRSIHHSTDSLLLNEARASIYLTAREFPQLGSITVYDMDNGGVEI
jgi:hypothetical protein